MTKKEQQEAERTALKSLILSWAKDPARFALEVLKSELRPKQIEFISAFVQNKRVTFKGGVGFGKTHVLAVITLWALVCHDEVKVTIFGPNEAQLKGALWNEIEMLFGRMPEWLKEQFKLTATEVERVHNGASCRAMWRLVNKDNVATIAGIHARNNFILVDEADGVPAEAFKKALVNHLTTDENPKLALISNPRFTTGYFYDTWNDELITDMWTKVHGKMSDNPFVNEQALDEATRQYGGKGSRDYMINVEGEFPMDDDDSLISAELINQAIDNEFVIPSPKRPEIWGVDPAGPGRDRSVILKRHDNVIVGEPIERRQNNSTQLAYLIRDMYQAEPKSKRDSIIIAVDANGLGRGLYDILKEFGLPVKAVTTQSSPTKGKDHNGNSKYAKLRDQLWWDVKEWFATENVRIPNCIPLIKELKAPLFDYDSKGAIKVEGKKEMKRRLKMSPDYADALCLTFAVDESKYVGKYSWSKPIEYGDLRYLE